MPTPDDHRDTSRTPPSTDPGPESKNFLRPLIAASPRLIAAGSSATFCGVVVFFHHVILVGLTCAQLAGGVAYLGRAVVHRHQDQYRHDRRSACLIDAERHFAWTWVGAALLLVVVAVVLADGLPSSLAVAAAGAFLAAATFVRAVALGGDLAEHEKQLELPGGSASLEASDRIQRWKQRAEAADELPLTVTFRDMWGRKRRVGKLSAYLASVLLAALVVLGGYGGFAVAYLGSAAVDEYRQHHDRSEDAGARATATTTDTTTATTAAPSTAAPSITVPAPTSADPDAAKPTYAELCPQLPDPVRMIEHRLGVLFASAGAVEAGCGGRARRLVRGGDVVVANGMCGAELRSLAVAGSGFEPVLLYGAAAAFALAAGSDLRSAEVAEPAGGDLVIVTTASGSTLFWRSSPSIVAGDGEDHDRCDEVDDVARPFVTLPPPMAELFLQQVLRAGWAWPATTLGRQTWTFVSAADDSVVASGSCVPSGCTLSAPGRPPWVFSGAPMISLADFYGRVPPPLTHR